MADHPIQGLMQTAMQNIKEMVDVNTILGDSVETPDGNVIIPISRVSFGFAAGGTEFEETTAGNGKEQSKDKPFGGGSGAGISLRPVAFLVVGNNQVRLLPVDGGAIFDRLLDYAPQFLDRMSGLMSRSSEVHLSGPTMQGRNTRQNQTDIEAGAPLGTIGPYA